MPKMKSLALSALVTAVLSVPLSASAAAILTNTANSTGYGLSSSSSSNMRLAIEGSHTLASTALFNNAAQLSSYDALWVNDQFGAMDSTQTSTITNFISAGHKAVFITDNGSWAGWNNSLEAMLGASITDTCAGANGSALVANGLTAGVPTLFGSSCNSIINPTANAQILFSNKMAAVYQVGLGEALLISSVDIVGNSLYSQNAQFAQNIVAWLDIPVTRNVPEPGTLALMGLGVLGLAYSRKKSKAESAAAANKIGVMA